MIAWATPIVVGVKTHENRDVLVTFPEDYQAAHLAGKLAVFKVTVKDIREKNMTNISTDTSYKKQENLDIQIM